MRNKIFPWAQTQLSLFRSAIKWWMPVGFCVFALISYLLMPETAAGSLSASLAASFVLTLWLAWQTAQSNAHLMRAFPLLRTSDRVTIVPASIPTATPHVVTGIGEARALGLLLERFSAVGFPLDKIDINTSPDYLPPNHMIVLGGPNYNVEPWEDVAKSYNTSERNH